MSDVLISFAREDRAWVESLAAALTKTGLSVTWDLRGRAGQSFDVQKEEALAAAKAVVVVWSAAALASHWVRAEAGDALERGILVPVLKEAVVPPLLFRHLASADMTRWNGSADAAFTALAGDLLAMTGRSAAPPPTTAPPVSGAPESGDERTVFRARALSPGEVIGHFRIVALLGEGGSGAIYEARNIHNEDERVALKIVLPDIADREQFFGFLRAEANAVQRVKHEAVVQYRTFGRIENSDEFFLVIEFVEGPTLGKVLRDGALEPARLRRLAVRLAHGLAAAHEQGVIHRDLSPDNIILPGGDAERATIIDFGIARNGAFDPLGTSFAGKLSYAAPEQFAGDAALIGPWTDLYSFGLVLAAAARGRRLDMGTDMESAIAARRAVPALDGVPAALQGPIAALLQPDPALRVRTAEEAARLFADAPPVEGPSEADAAVAGIAAPRRRLWPWLAAVGGGLAAAALTTVLLLPKATPERTAASEPAAAATPAPPPVPPPAATADASPGASAAPTGPTATPAAEPAPPPELPEGGVDARLVPIVDNAIEAADAAGAAAARADIAAAKADEAVAAAKARAADAREVAELGVKAHETACTPAEPPAGYSCGTSEDGTRYGGEEVCADGVCKGHGYNSYTGPDGARVDGRMKDNAFVSGCRTEPGVLVYCGDMADGSLTGYGVMTLADGHTLTGLFRDGALEPRGLWDAAKEANALIDSYRGETLGGKLSGAGEMTLTDMTVIGGDWTDDRAAGFGAVGLRDGTQISAAFADGAARIGAVKIGIAEYPGGQIYAGEFASNDAMGEVRREGLGVLFGADGTILQQGRWKDDRLAEDFGAP